MKAAKLDDMARNGGIEVEEPEEGDWAYTIEEYVQIEQESELLKHEYVNGQIRAMSGGSHEHSRMPIALAVQLSQQLKGRPCEVCSADARIRIKAANVITYPDLSVFCADVKDVANDTVDPYAQTNPIVLVEITSKSSERYDRGKKRLFYQQLESLRDYVIVSQRDKQIDVYSRAEDGTWGEPVRYGAGQRARIPSINCDVDIDELYTSPMGRRLTE